VGAKVWDAATGEPKQEFPAVGVCQVGFSPDGPWFVTNGGNRVRLWRTGTWDEGPRLHEAGDGRGWAFSPDGRLLALGGHGRVRLVRPDTGVEVARLALPEQTKLEPLCFTPDGGELLVAGEDTEAIHIWDLRLIRAQLAELDIDWDDDPLPPAGPPGTDTPRAVEFVGVPRIQELLSLRGHTNAVTCAVFSPDGKQRLASASRDGTVRVWDTATRQELLTLRGHTSTVWRVVFSPDSKRLVSASWDATVKVWDPETGQELLTLPGNAKPVSEVCFSPSGKRLATASGGWDAQRKYHQGEVKVWDAETGQELLTMQGNNGGLLSVSWSADGKRLAGAGYDKAVKVWDAETGQELLVLGGHTARVWSIAFSPDGKRLASAGDDSTVMVWDVERGQEVLALKRHTNSVVSVSWSPDGKRLASAGWDQTVQVWDAETGHEDLALGGHGGTVSCVSWSADGKRLATADYDKTVRIWDVDKEGPP
jgi:WD40 repeat protein